MGAAASVRMVYSQALMWLKTYIDSDTYIADFAAIDKDHDGGVTFGELQKWIMDKSKKDPDGSWHVFKDHPQIMQIAHKAAGMGIDSTSSSHAGKVVDIGEFRLLLMHLFAVSILMAHFEHADDLGNKQLDFDEFKKAVFTFCETHAHEHIPEDKIREDFDMLDTNKSDTLGFVEVCTYCCKFIDPSFLAEGEVSDRKGGVTVSHKTSRLLGVDQSDSNGSPHQINLNDMGELGSSGPKYFYQSSSVSQKTSEAFKSIASVMEDQLVAVDKLMERVDAGEISISNSPRGEKLADRKHRQDSIAEESEIIENTATDFGAGATDTTETIESATTTAP